YIPLPTEEVQSVKEEVEEYRNVPYLTEAIGTLTADADKMGLAHLMADEGRKTAGTDLAFYHIGGTRLGGLKRGDVSRADIYELEPFQSFLVVTTMTAEDIKAMIINKFNDTTNQKESHRVDLIPSGLNYTILTDRNGDAVDVRLHPEVRKEVYTVAIADYVYGNKVYSYPRRESTGRTGLVTDYLIECLATAPYTPDNTPRGKIVRR
ncbi:MAG: 5'-nucleotidase C-terminal domain-containing protein, partial [Tidjanibacter sp.]|nr:5'-nucleotidase C-terminal domain-containing protein [Tidjanibacter sp.]